VDTPAITKEILFGLVNVLVRDQPGVIRAIASDEACAGFNPQPDPPGIVHDPWRAVAVSRAIISLASLSMSSSADEANGIRASRRMLAAFVDDFCGTSAHRRPSPLPPPWPRFDLRPNALDMVIAAAQFHAASVALKDHPLSNDLATGADRLLAAALSRLAP
jgi:hypothetical protein